MQPGRTVSTGDRVTVDGDLLPVPGPARLFRLHKPPGVVTARADPAGRPTVFDLLPGHLPYLHPVGRLDIASEGLLLLTTDGSLKRWLELPRTGLPRHYRVRVHGRIDPARLGTLASGARIRGVLYGPVVAGCAVITIWCLSHYNLDRERHAEILGKLAERRRAGARPGALDTAAGSGS